MNDPTAYKTNFTFDGKVLYRIEGEPCRLYLLKTHGDVAAYVQWQSRWLRFSFERCHLAEAELESLGWLRTDEGRP